MILLTAISSSTLDIPRVAMVDRATSSGHNVAIGKSDSATYASRSEAVVNHSRSSSYGFESSSTNSPTGWPHWQLKRPARKRASRPKVRTGCINCKQRHLKCDEKKPNCTRCKDYGVHCQGYAASNVAARGDRCLPKRFQRPLLPRPASIPNTATILSTTAVQFKAAEQSKAPVRTDENHLHCLHRSPALIPRLSNQDAMYLDYFLREVAEYLSPYYLSRFWSSISLREIPGNECILQAVLGIGACSRAIEEARTEIFGTKGPNTVLTPALGTRRSLWLHARENRHHRAALVHYSKAIGILRSTLEIHNDARNAMVATLLFITLENMQGNYQAAGALIRSGLKILGGGTRGRTTERGVSCRSKTKVETPPQSPSWTSVSKPPAEGSSSPSTSCPYRSRPSLRPVHPSIAYLQIHSDFPDEDTVEIARMYARHSITRLFMPFPHCRSAYHMLTETPVSFGVVSRLDKEIAFSTIQEAQTIWDLYLPSLANFVQKCTWHNLNLAYEFDIRAARRQQSYHEAWLGSFGTALGYLDSIRCIKRKKKAFERDDKLPLCASVVALLTLQYTVASIFTKCCLDPSELMYDAHVDQFREIISRCRGLTPCLAENSRALITRVSKGDHDASRGRQRLFFVNDAGILPILGFVACKCRDRVVRQEALCLIEHSDWREGGWDSLSLARGIRALLELEDMGMESSGRSLSSSARFAWTNASSHLSQGTLNLEFTRLLPSEDGEYAKTELQVPCS
ncbi:hypothetical protein BR93DRAFT_926396 [Coniochaeta sp. PMI_546]|nr:hypothetical protein BR93DRAFT_926396 [Coniochaeta sp. PMI_546]